jgi:hypothetical protein
MNDSTDSAATKVVLEIPDALDPAVADRKYTEPLRQLLHPDGVGTIAAVEQGKPNTPEKFSRIITLQLTNYEDGMAVIQRFLVQQDAPVGTMITSYDANGETLDILLLGPPNDGE